VIQTMIAIFFILLKGYFYFVIFYFIAVNITYIVLFVISYREIIRHMRHNLFGDYRIMVQSELTAPVSVLAPAYNEESTVVESVRSLLKLNYGEYEVVVINDGSKDTTLQQLIEEYKLFKSKQIYLETLPTKTIRGIYRSSHPSYRHLIVLDKENGGKADALNAGINVSRYDYICCIDADSLLEEEALLRVMKPFMEDDRVVAAGGIVRIANGCKVESGRVVEVGISKKVLPIFQIVEYFRAFLSGRMAWHGVNALLIISGALGMFKKSAVIEAEGYKHDTVGEDMELVTRIHRVMRERKIPYKVVFVPDPVCWTEAPESVSMLARQRNRWHRGLIDTMLLHRTMMMNRKYGSVGTAAMPYFLFIELLGPVFEFFGYLSLVVMLAVGILNVNMVILFFIVALAYGVMFSVAAVMLEEVSFRRYPKPGQLALLLSFGVIENFGYRQMTVWWRIRAFYDYFTGVKSWGEMKRKGWSTQPPQS
jgi:cellulose synthase/poly-beta-1,6-N-acetylglucosamine synthase-like glycosyltransferase